MPCNSEENCDFLEVLQASKIESYLQLESISAYPLSCLISRYFSLIKFFAQSHREDVEEELFGKGKLDLTDPSETDDVENPPDESEDPPEDNKKATEEQSTKGYGSVDTTSPKNSLWTINTPVSSEKKEEEEEEANDLWSDPKPPEDEESPLLETKENFHERPGRPEKPSRHCIVSTFYTIESFAMITNLFLLTSQILPLISVSWDESDPAYLALKIYLCVFAVIFVLVEADLSAIPFLRSASFLKTYCSRGFLYTFFGLVCYEEADSEKAYTALEARAHNDSSVFRVSWFALVNQIAAISLLAVGVLYFVMGILCLQRLRNKYVYDDRKKWEVYKEALDKWDQGV